jgi:hypothetical protein
MFGGKAQKLSGGFQPVQNGFGEEKSDGHNVLRGFFYVLGYLSVHSLEPTHNDRFIALMKLGALIFARKAREKPNAPKRLRFVSTVPFQTPKLSHNQLT